ncbi:MAG TPA: flagellar FlbD family protein [Candidatus Cybelea sp.]|jgi:flagellar protein FlbD|nr:flagellar FlbD family protein [Candidatus Cybelea sp.]
MITLTRENGQPVLLNCDLIETVEENGKSVITLTTGNAVLVRERLHEIEAKVVEYKQKIYGR